MAENTITGITYSTDRDNATVKISASNDIVSFQKPERIGKSTIVRIPDAGIRVDALDESSLPAGIRIGTERIRNISLIKIEAEYDSATIRRNGPRELVVSLSKRRPAIPSAQKKSSNWNLDVIVIDAGHGGQDAGAEGVNGVYEKDVTLSIALALQKLVVKEMPGTKVVLTRDDDIFIPLSRRTDIANDAKGSIFVSIHCNSMPTKPHPAHGCETYILRPGRNEDAARVASRENSSIRYESQKHASTNIAEDQLIIATMAQRSFVRFSEELARAVQRHVSTATGLENRGVSQAGFYVLVGASMPNILFETAFLSNEKDAEFVSSTSGQQKIARAMLNAIKAYSRTYTAQLNK